MRPLILEGINNQVHTYFDTLKQLYKSQRDEECTKKKGLIKLQMKHDQRTHAVHA